MKVLSLFDGIACWYEALLKAWINVEEYYASEIDKYAIQIAKKNHPDIKEIWDVKMVRGGEYICVDLLIGWSPCQWFSTAWKKMAFDDPRSRLFFEYVRILKESKPKYFLLENVDMKKERVDIISEHLWVQPIKINSSLLSAQNRKRLYRTNIPWVKIPEDKWIRLKDILQENVDGDIKSELIQDHNWEIRIKQATSKWYIVAEDGDWIDLNYPSSKTRRWRVIKQKSNTLQASWIGNVLINGKIRKLTPIEWERLQTLPDNYTEWISENQRYKVLWNGWTVDVIAHILKYLNE